MDQFTKDLAEMLKNRGNKWLKFEHLDVYVRVSEYFISNGEYTGRIKCVQIANVSTDEVHQRKGSFTRMLEVIKCLTTIPIYLENVHNHEFRDAMIKRGFLPCRFVYDVATDLVLPRET